MKEFIIYLGDDYIDTVFFDSDMSDYEVLQSLIDHDGYPSGITVKTTI